MLKKIRKILEKEKKVIFAYVFGSYARSKYFKDVDIAVFVRGKTSLDFETDLALKIEREIKKPVDVILLNDKPLLVVSEVLKNGKLIFSKDERRRINYEVLMLSKILDFNELMKEFDKIRFERYGIR